MFHVTFPFLDDMNVFMETVEPFYDMLCAKNSDVDDGEGNIGDNDDDDEEDDDDDDEEDLNEDHGGEEHDDEHPDDDEEECDDEPATQAWPDGYLIIPK